MPLLSQPSKKPAPSSRLRKRSASAAPVFALAGNQLEAKLGEATVTALKEGALWIAEAKTLIVSDLHLEKGSSLARDGQMLPPYDTHATLSRVEALMHRLAPDIVVSLGDSFHDGGGPARMHERDRALLQTLIGRCDWIWVEGNHDGRSAETLGGIVREGLTIGALHLVHKPAKCLAPGEIAGHLHPCAKVSGRGRVVRRRCFATDGSRLVMPAFGAYAGGLNVCHGEFAPLFPNGLTALVMGRTRVLPAPMQRLLAD